MGCKSQDGKGRVKCLSHHQSGTQRRIRVTSELKWMLPCLLAALRFCYFLLVFCDRASWHSAFVFKAPLLHIHSNKLAASLHSPTCQKCQHVDWPRWPFHGKVFIKSVIGPHTDKPKVMVLFSLSFLCHNNTNWTTPDILKHGLWRRGRMLRAGASDSSCNNHY